MSEKICGIYKITNLVNGKVYIGQSVDIYERWAEHKYNMSYTKYQNILLYKAFHKYGIENFSFDIIDYCVPEELNEKEIYYIKEFNSWVGYDEAWGYNMTIGGEGNNGAVRTQEWNNKIAQSNKGHIPWNKGIRYSCPIISQKLQGENNPFYGHHHTNETKEKIRKARLGKTPHNNKKVICLTTGEIFDSITEAAKAKNTNNTSIGMVCTGKRKSAGITTDGIKLKWQYYKDYLKGGENECEKT